MEASKLNSPVSPVSPDVDIEKLAEQTAETLGPLGAISQAKFLHTLLTRIGHETEQNKKSFSFILIGEKDMNGVKVRVSEYECQPLCIVQHLLHEARCLTEIHAGPVHTHVKVFKALAPDTQHQEIGEVVISGDVFGVTQDTDGILHEIFKIQQGEHQK